MEEFVKSPEWFGTAVIGAIIAACGFVGKLIIDLFQSILEKRQRNRAKLIELRSLLRASNSAFKIQKRHAKRLTASIKKGHGEYKNVKGYEKVMSSAYKILNERQKELHAIIRGMTMHALYPTNKETLAWLKKDTYFKAQRNEFASKLSHLEAHLILWIAKYKARIPDDLTRALIYMADEEAHGVGFPDGLDSLVDNKTGLEWEKKKVDKEMEEKEDEESVEELLKVG